MEDPFKVLGLSRDATETQIEEAFRRLSKEFHPDMPGGDDTVGLTAARVDALELSKTRRALALSAPRAHREPAGSR